MQDRHCKERLLQRCNLPETWIAAYASQSRNNNSIFSSIMGICLLILFITVFLSSCSTTTSHPDGAPPYPVDETKIPNAIPKKEALSKYGNDKTYRVFGKTYHTLASSKHYQAQGMASWYGTRFHSIRTSSGERYNMLAMTAAHKTLPLPSYVQVTNLRNGKKVIVKVNDRGPFVENRLIDLSYVAAKKLGMIGKGTARVDVKAIDIDAYNSNNIKVNTPLTRHHVTAKHLAMTIPKHSRLRPHKKHGLAMKSRADTYS